MNERIQGVKRSSFLKLFPATAPLQDIAIDILGPLVMAKSGCEYLLVITDRYSKLTRAIPMTKISAYIVAKAFCDNWIFVYGPPRSVLSDNGKRLTRSSSGGFVRYSVYKTCSPQHITHRPMGRLKGSIEPYYQLYVTT